jgi:hypothetical protein
LLCVAGRARAHVERFLDASKGDVVVDYQDGDDAVISGLVAAVEGKGYPPVRHALDAVAEGSSIANVGEVFRRVGEASGERAEGMRATYVLTGAAEKEGVPEGVERSTTYVGCVHKDAKDFGYVFFRYFARGLQEGWFQAQRTEVVPGGLGGVETALQNLKDGKASAVKYVFRIADTEGAGK